MGQMAAPPPDSNPNLQRAQFRLTKTANGSRVMGVHQKLRAILLTSTSRLMEVTRSYDLTCWLTFDR